MHLFTAFQVSHLKNGRNLVLESVSPARVYFFSPPMRCILCMLGTSNFKTWWDSNWDFEILATCLKMSCFLSITIHNLQKSAYYDQKNFHISKYENKKPFFCTDSIIVKIGSKDVMLLILNAYAQKTVHPQNVRFQNVRFQKVRFQNVWNIRFTKRQV